MRITWKHRAVELPGGAMAMEALAREHGIPGRIVPVPSEIDAGCGLAWLIPPGETLSVKDVGAYEAIHEVTLWL